MTTSSKTTTKLTQRNGELLARLGQFQYLTVSQMIRLGLAAYPSGMGQQLGKLLAGNRPLIDRVGWSRIVASKGGGRKVPIRQEDMYFLLPRAARWLTTNWTIGQDEQPTIRYPKDTPAFARDYQYRKATIDCQIELVLFTEQLGCQLYWFYSYFEMIGSNWATNEQDQLHSKTRIVLDAATRRYCTPDSLFLLHDP